MAQERDRGGAGPIRSARARASARRKMWLHCVVAWQFHTEPEWQFVNCFEAMGFRFSAVRACRARLVL
eukprot:3381727-Pleurochrysis_carterae.AAC.1